MPLSKTIRLSKAVLGTYFKKPIAGPYSVYLGITDRCNYQCIFCKYDHFQKDFIDDPKKTLPFNLIKQCIQDLGEMGTQHINFISWGEPFTHPNFLEILAEIKKNRMTMGLLTNGYKLSKDIVDELIDLHLDALGISLNAASGETYERLHLNQPAKTFNKIKNNLLYLNEEKRKRHIKYPILSVSFVITTINYKDIEDMVKLTKEVGGEKINFENVRIYSPDKEYLKLNKSQLEKVAVEFNRLKTNASLEFSFKNFSFNTHGMMPDIGNSQLPDNCYVGYVGPTGISPDGSIRFCCACGIPVGTLYEKSFMDIWHDSLMQKYREKGRQMWREKEGLFGDCCHRCADADIYNRIHNKFHFWQKSKNKLLPNKS